MAALTLGSIILSGPGGTTAPEALMTRARHVAGADLVGLLHQAGVGPVVVAGPDLDWVPDWPQVIKVPDVHASFHFGKRLAELIKDHELSPVIYFGAGSAPLLGINHLREIMNKLAAREAQPDCTGGRRLVTNNLHSADWLGFTHAFDALDTVSKAERDNGLAWMLHTMSGYAVDTLTDASPALSMDLDTPADLALVARHPDCSGRLRAAADDALLAQVPVQRVAEAIARDGSHTLIAGRVAPAAWQALSRASQSWIRVFSEERGMVASERLTRGEVRSLLFALYDRLGPDGFFAELGRMADVAILDSRVLFAARGQYPSDSERFASDLYALDLITDPWLRHFTEAAAHAPIPILLGGHSVVSGGLHILAEIVRGLRQQDPAAE